MAPSISQRIGILCIAIAACAIAAPAHAAPRDPAPELSVGAELLAVRDVTLHRAEIAKGSRVSVTRVVERDGQIDAVDIALADGHVVKVSLAIVRASFRVAND